MPRGRAQGLGPPLQTARLSGRAFSRTMGATDGFRAGEGAAHRDIPLGSLKQVSLEGMGAEARDPPGGRALGD